MQEDRGRQDRDLVLGRSQDRPEEQDHAPLGPARHPPGRAARPAYALDLHLRRHLCPAEGKGAGVVLPFCNTATMKPHLAEVSQAVASDAHAILVVDQVGWHTTDKLDVPDNITIVPLPPPPGFNPGVNPVENVWQYMRENWLSNRVFASYDDIVAHCCEAWNKLVDQPRKIMSIGNRDWAHRS